MPTPARTSKNKKDYADIVVVSETDETFTARIFGDSTPFTFSKDVNGFLQLAAYSGEPGAFNDFMFHMLEVEVADDASDDDIEDARFKTKKRFKDLLSGTKGLSIQRLIKFSVDITEIAGNGQAE